MEQDAEFSLTSTTVEDSENRFMVNFESLDIKSLKLRARTTKTSVTMALLGELADAAGYLSEPFFRRYRFVAGTKRNQAWQTLRKQKLVEARRIGDRLEIAITASGITRAKLERLRAIKKRLPPGITTLVIFDFPESEHSRRDLWRRFLKWTGFTQVQKSVWEIGYDMGDELAQFINDVGANEWVEVYKATKVRKRKV